jgi:hypothetical protein
MNLILAGIGFYAINKSISESVTRKKKKATVVIGLILWQVYVYLLSKSGFLENLDFPPRFVLFLILPLFIFTGVFLYKNRNEKWIKVIPPHWLTYYQSFRIGIETIFVYTVAAGILHTNVTIEGYNMDLLYALSAPVIGTKIYKKGMPTGKFIRIWNYLGLTVIASIIFLFITSMYAPQLYGSEVGLLSTKLGTYPFTLVAGFLMPSAVFIHVLSLVQARKS